MRKEQDETKNVWWIFVLYLLGLFQNGQRGGLSFMKEIDLSKIHDCEKCHEKIVGISVDKLGSTYCGYCHERVDYSSLRISKQELKDFLGIEEDELLDKYLEEK